MARLPMPFNNPRTYAGHSGVDFPQPLGTPIRASGPGKVLRLPHNTAGAYWTTIRYDIGETVGYAHQDRPVTVVKVGQRITEGTVIGYVGNSGNSTGPHLHMERIGHATYAGMMAILDTNRVVNGAGPAGGSGMWDIAKRQRFLNQIGANAGTVDGKTGPKTRAATKTFQQWTGLTADGIWGGNTQDMAETVMGGKNFTDRPTTEIQSFLKSKGLYPGAIDGKWGNGTSIGTLRYQRSVSLKADAQWGKNTDAKAFPPKPDPKPDPKPVAGKNATTRPLKEIQAFLKVSATGVWDQATSDATAAYQTAQHIEVDRVWGVTCDGLAFPPTDSLHGVDYSFARPDPRILASRSIKHAGRYLYHLLYQDGSGKQNKGISAAENTALEAQGIQVWHIYEEDGKELLGGFEAGVRVAKAAEIHRIREGLAAKPIYFNVDYDAPAADMPTILNALRGVASVIGLDRTGLYAGHGPIKAAFDAGVIRWGFQTYAWSGGKWDARAQLQQWSNGQWGGTVDFTRAMTVEYGQTPVEVNPEPEMVQVPRVELEALHDKIGGWLS